MKNKKINYKLISPLLLLTVPPMMASLSCSVEQPLQEPEIDISLEDNVIYSRHIEIPFQLNVNDVEQLSLTLIDETSGVVLTETAVTLDKGTGLVKIDLQNQISSGNIVHFLINFYGKSENGLIVDIIKDGFDFVYVDPQEKEETDILYPISTCNVQNDSHYFSYKVNFSNVPTSREVVLNLFGDDEKNFELLDTRPLIQKTQSEIFIEFRVKLDFKISHSRACSFNMQFYFVNSYGKAQVNEIRNYVANFIRSEDKGKAIPIEYFNLRTTESGEIAMRGLKHGVRSVDLMPYSEIVIPDNVIYISDVLDTDDHKFNWSKNIKKIKFNGKEKQVFDYFFREFPNLYEIDLSKYEEEYPDWVKGHIFTSELRNIGYVWASSDEFAKQIQFDLFESTGSKPEWRAFNVNSVTDENFFVINDDGNIERISEEGKKKISNIKVIKFPENINGINTEALTPFKRQPYINMLDPNNPVKETRRLILDLDLNNICSKPKMGEGVFSNMGVSGPILMNCPHLQSFGDYEFYDLNNYDLSCLDDIVIEDKTYVDIFNLAELTSFGKLCFALSYLSDFVGKTQLLSNMKTINDFAFYCNRFTEVTLPSIETVGDRAFADTYSWEHEGTILNIDLSSYNQIINPDEVSEQKRTRIPEWWTKPNYVFKGQVCTDPNIRKFIYLSNEIKNEIEYKHTQWGEADPTSFPDLDTWEKNFKAYLGIIEKYDYESWKIVYV